MFPVVVVDVTTCNGGQCGGIGDLIVGVHVSGGDDGEDGEDGDDGDRERTIKC